MKTAGQAPGLEALGDAPMTARTAGAVRESRLAARNTEQGRKSMRRKGRG
jgi:hypothetical protein